MVASHVHIQLFMIFIILGILKLPSFSFTYVTHRNDHTIESATMKCLAFVP